MSGICGICQVGREFNAGVLEPIMYALTVSGESERELRGGKSAFLGLAKRWHFQHTAAVDDVIVVADADLVDVTSSAEELPAGAVSSSGNIAHRIAGAYLKHGPDFLTHLRGAFSIALWDGKKQTL